MLPASDKRLVSLEHWMREHLDPDQLDMATAALEQIGPDWPSHYLYFGVVPPRRIKAIGRVQLPASEQVSS